MPAQSLLTDREASEILSVTRKTLQMWRSKGRGPRYIKACGAVRYRQCDLEKWIEASTHLTLDDEK